MTPITTERTALRSLPRPHILAKRVEREDPGWTSWITTVDHKKLGIMYLVTSFIFFILGGVEAMLMRTQLALPDNTLLTPEKYNQLMTLHGTTMLFLVVVPLCAGFGNYYIPLMIGARHLAFPRINAWLYCMSLFGGIVV